MKPQRVYVAAPATVPWRKTKLYVTVARGGLAMCLLYDSAATMITETVLGTCVTTLATASGFYVTTRHAEVTVDSSSSQ